METYDQDYLLPIWAFILFLPIIIFEIVAMWKVFTKAGQPGWACIIPIYNTYVMTKIAGKPGIWTLLCLIPVINIIFVIWLYNMISKSFGKDEGFTVGLVVLSVVFWPILGFGKSTYLGPYGNPEAFVAYQDNIDSNSRTDGENCLRKLQ